MAEHADGSIIVDTEIDAQGFKAGSSELQRAVKSLNNKIQSLGPTFQKAISGNSSAISSFDAKASGLGSTITELESKMKSLGNTPVPTDDYQWLSTEIQKTKTELAKLEEKQAKMESTGVDKSSKAWQALRYDIDLAERKISEYENEQTQMRNSGTAFLSGADTVQYAQLSTALADAKAKFTEMQAQISGNHTQINSLFAAMRNAPTLTERLKTSLLGVINTAKRISNTFQGTGMAIKTAVTHPLHSINKGIGSVISGLGYLGSKGVSAFKKVGCAIKGGITKMRQFAKQSNRSSFSMNSLSGKMKMMAMMIKQMLVMRIFMGILNSIGTGFKNLSRYSTQTNKDLSTLKSALTQLKNSFGTAFAPILTAVTPVITTLINHLSSAITYIGKFAAALTGAKTFTKAAAVQEDFAASLGTTGSAAEKAQKQLAGFDELNVLSDSSSGGGGGGGASGVSPSEMFEEVPIESSITDFANRLKTAFKKGDYAEIGRIIGNGINTALQKINKLISWDNVGNTVTKVVSGIAEGFNSLIYMADWELLGDTVAQGLNTILNSLYLIITKFDWPAVTAALARSLNGLVFGFNWSKLGTTVSTGFITALKSIRNAITTFNWAGLGSSVTEGINKIDWVGAFKQAVGALSGAIKGLLDLCIGFSEKLDWGKLGSDLWKNIVAVVTEIDWGGIVSKAFRLLGNAIGGAAKLLVEFAKSFWESLKSAWESTKSYFSQYCDETGHLTIEGFFQGIWDAIKNVGNWIVENIWNPFIEGFKNAFGIHSPPTKMVEMGKYIIEGLWNGIKAAWSGIVDFFKNALSKLSDLIKKVWSNIKNTASAAWNGIKGVILGVWDGIKSGVSNAYNTVKTDISDAWNNIKSTASIAWNGIKSVVSNAWSGIKTNVSSAYNTVKSGISNAWNSIKSTASTAWTNVKTTITNAWSSIDSTIFVTNSNIKSTVSSAWDSLKTTMSNKLSSIRDSVSSTFITLKNNASTWGKDLCHNMANGISKAKSTVESAVKGVADKIKSFLGFSEPEDGPLSDFHTYMPDMIDLMAYGIKKNQRQVIGAVSDMAAAISGEIQNGDYKLGGIKVSNDIDSALAGFSDNVANSFSNLLERLQAIADGVTFSVPAMATGTIVPYSVSASTESGNNVTGAIEASNEELGSVIIQAVTSATTAIVTAIEANSGTVVSFDINSLAASTIKEINRRTRAMGKSPLVTT